MKYRSVFFGIRVLLITENEFTIMLRLSPQLSYVYVVVISNVYYVAFTYTKKTKYLYCHKLYLEKKMSDLHDIIIAIL